MKNVIINFKTQIPTTRLNDILNEAMKSVAPIATGDVDWEIKKA